MFDTLDLAAFRTDEFAKFETLTRRQREVFALRVQGKSCSEIGPLLGLSRKTIETHLAQVHNRMGAKDLPTLTKMAIRLGVTELWPRE